MLTTDLYVTPILTSFIYGDFRDTKSFALHGGAVNDDELKCLTGLCADDADVLTVNHGADVLITDRVHTLVDRSNLCRVDVRQTDHEVLQATFYTYHYKSVYLCHTDHAHFGVARRKQRSVIFCEDDVGK